MVSFSIRLAFAIASLLCAIVSLSLISHFHHSGDLAPEVAIPLMGMVVIVFLLPPAGWFLVKALEWNSHHNRTIRRMQANVGRQGSHNAANPNSSAIPLVNFNTSVNSLPDTIPPAYTRSPPSTISRTSRERRERGELDSSLTEWSIKCIGHPFGPYANPSSLLVPTPPAPVANPGIAFATFTQNVQTIANASN